MFDPEYTISLYFNGSEALTQTDIDRLSDWIAESEENGAKFIQASFMHRGIYDSLTGEVSQKNALFDLIDLAKSDSGVLIDSNVPLRGVDMQDVLGDADDFYLSEDSEMTRAMLELLELERTSPAVVIEKPEPVKPKRELIQKVENNFKWFPGEGNKPLTLALLTMAACFMVFIGYLHFNPAPLPLPVVAYLDDSIDAVWDDELTQPDEYDKSMVQSRYRLKKGYASILFNSGAKVTVEAPAELSLSSAGDMELFSGKIYAVVPQRAHGFSVMTAGNKIVDLGTEFGVEVDSNNNTQLHVTKGKTKLFAGLPNGKKSEVNVDAGAAKKVYNDGFVKDILLENSKFVRNIKSKSGGVFIARYERVIFEEKFDRDENEILNKKPEWKYLNGAESFVNLRGRITDSSLNPDGRITVVRPFIPELNKTYTVSLDVTNPTSGWIGLGFCRKDGSTARYSKTFEYSGVGWMRYGNLNPSIAAYSGVDSVSEELIDIHGAGDGLKKRVDVIGSVYKANPTRLTVKLDTAGNREMFKVEFFQDGIKVAGPVSIPSNFFHHVGFSYKKSENEFENSDGILLDNFIITVLE